MRLECRFPSQFWHILGPIVVFARRITENVVFPLRIASHLRQSAPLSFFLAFSCSSRAICRFPSHFPPKLSFSLAEFHFDSACLSCVSAQIRTTFRCQVLRKEAGVRLVSRLVNVEVLLKTRSLNLMCTFKVGFKRFLNLGRQVIKVDALLLNFSTQTLRAASCTCQASYQILSELL